MRRDPQWLERLRTIQTVDEADLPDVGEAVQINDRERVLRTCREAMQNSRDHVVRVKAADLLSRIRGFYG